MKCPQCQAEATQVGNGIMGAPGVGKSAFAAQLTHTRGDTVIATQFCEWDKPDHRNAPRVRSLAFQLATRLPDYRKLLLTPAGDCRTGLEGRGGTV